ncbi:hypothetical protein [Bacillus sp. OAE603]|uniref:hypothetical protein n=1 Tax=Gottfriedia sp. OAE603 TaxID=2663872 RepID=UPI00178B7857
MSETLELKIENIIKSFKHRVSTLHEEYKKELQFEIETNLNMVDLTVLGWQGNYDLEISAYYEVKEFNINEVEVIEHKIVENIIFNKSSDLKMIRNLAKQVAIIIKENHGFECDIDEFIN